MMKTCMKILTNPSILKPNYRVTKIGEITAIPSLMSLDKQIFIFDKDDTIVPLHEFRVNSVSTSIVLSRIVKDEDKKAYVVSNSVHEKNLFVTYFSSNE